jgi:hypothetical protein
MRDRCVRGLLLSVTCALAACGLTDAATRLAADIKAGASQLGSAPGAQYSVRHITPSKAGECIGPYSVQLDKVGALIVWCRDASGQTVSSHSTSMHARYVATPETYRIDKPERAPLTIELERRGGQAVITAVR